MKRFWQLYCLLLLSIFQPAWGVDSRDATPFISSSDSSVHALVEKEAPAQIALTEEEQAWLAEHQEVRIGVMEAWPPHSFIGKNGMPHGIGVDYISAINQRLNGVLKIVPGPWEKIYDEVINKQLDAVIDITPNPKREPYFNFTSPHLEIPHVIIARTETPYISSGDELEGKTIALERGFVNNLIFQENYPNVRRKQYKDTSSALDAVVRGEVDAYVGNRAVATYLMEKEVMVNLKVHGRMKNRGSILAIGTRKDWPILRDILQKAMDTITRKEKQSILRKWVDIEEKKPTEELHLTLEEKNWLKQHPDIQVGVMNAWPPFDFVDSDGKAQGIGVDYINALNQRLNGVLKIAPGPWKKIYDDVANSRLDALLDITPKPSREPSFDFTSPYLDIPHVIVARKETPYIGSEEEMEGKAVALEKGFGNVLYFQEKYPNVRIKQYKDTSSALDAVARGEADAYAGNRAVATYLMGKGVMVNLKVHGRMKKAGSILAIGTRKDWPILRNILQKSLNSITSEEKLAILRKWTGFEEKQPTKELHLTTDEKEWLAEHKRMRLGVDFAWPPVEWIDEAGHYHGMTSEYIDIIGNMLGVEMLPNKKLDWVDILEKAKHGEIDIIPAINPSIERKKSLNFTSPYLLFPFVIFTRDDAPFITELRDLYGKQVAVEEGYVSQEYLERDHPGINLHTYKTTEEILRALSLGEIDAYVGNLPVAGYIIGKTGLTNIKVAAPTPYSNDLSIGVRKDWPELIPILDRALSKIDEEQRNAIRQKWLQLRYEVGVDYVLIKRTVAGATIVILMVFGWMLFIQRQKRELKAAKAETEAANIKLQKANIKLKELDHLKSMFIASISHELRTPLNSIIGFSGMMVRGTYGELGEKYQDYITRINRSGQHLLALITDIIDISKLESGRIDIAPSDFELDEMITEAVDSIRQQVENKGLTLETNIPPGISLHTDRRRLLQCLLNFLSNAMKFTEHGTVCVTVNEQPESILLSVRDTGIGISEKDCLRLFEAFEQIDSRLRVKAGGTGLGLYLTKKIAIDLLQGEVGMDSRLGEGSTFWISVPKTVTTQQARMRS